VTGLGSVFKGPVSQNEQHSRDYGSIRGKKELVWVTWRFVAVSVAPNSKKKVTGKNEDALRRLVWEKVPGDFTWEEGWTPSRRHRKRVRLP